MPAKTAKRFLTICVPNRDDTPANAFYFAYDRQERRGVECDDFSAAAGICDLANEFPAPPPPPEPSEEELAHLGCVGNPSDESEPDPDDARQLERDFHLD